jgi:hypothetical protein
MTRYGLAPLLLTWLLAACGSGDASQPGEVGEVADVSEAAGEAQETQQAEFRSQVLTHTAPQALSGVASGAWEQHSLEWGRLPVDPGYIHALSFLPEAFMSPVMSPSAGFGPLILYSDDMQVLVFSPMDHFFESLIKYENGEIIYGLEGELQEVPAGFTQRFLLVEGRGLAATVLAWGDLLLADRGRARTDRYADTGLSRLGYWTDNGAFYYYHTAPGLNEAETLLAVKADADARGIPLGYVQLDSWFYYKADGGTVSGLVTGGVTSWQPQAQMFPDGLPAFREALGLPLITHNKWFAPDNTYRATHPFVESEKCSLPTDRGVWEEFMADAVSWGVETYEQDWLANQYQWLPYLREGVGRAEQWMRDLTGAAADRGLTVQLCMPSAAHLLDTLDHSNVTTIRTSVDYHPVWAKEAYWPQFHTVNMLAWALGVLPFKDNFWSSERHEPAETGLGEALVSLLSAGMVGPGDEIGRADPVILGHTCRLDGLLLKPDRPALPIDAMFLPHRRPYTVATHSSRPGLGTWHYVAAIVLASKHPERTGKDAGMALAAYFPTRVEDMFVFPEQVDDWHLDPAADLGARGRLVAWDWRAGTGQVVEGALELPPLEHLYDFHYLVLAPVAGNGLALIGETGKFATLADKRFTAVQADAQGLDLTLAGVPGEQVTLQAFDADAGQPLQPLSVTIGADGSAQARLAR